MVFTASALLLADKKSDAKFSPGPASSYSAKQTNDNVTVAVSAYDTEELAHTAFGKLDPNQYGVLPVLVIIQNDTGRGAEAGPPGSGVHLGGPAACGSHAAGGSADLGRRAPAFAAQRNAHSAHQAQKPAEYLGNRRPGIRRAQMLPPHESANGFFYFQTEHRPGAKFYLTGIKVAATGKDILYFEIPLDYHR